MYTFVKPQSIRQVRYTLLKLPAAHTVLKLRRSVLNKGGEVCGHWYVAGAWQRAFLVIIDVVVVLVTTLASSTGTVPYRTTLADLAWSRDGPGTGARDPWTWQAEPGSIYVPPDSAKHPDTFRYWHLG